MPIKKSNTGNKSQNSKGKHHSRIVDSANLFSISFHFYTLLIVLCQEELEKLNAMSVDVFPKLGKICF